MNKGDFRFNLKSLKVKCSGKTEGTLAAASNGRIAFSYDEISKIITQKANKKTSYFNFRRTENERKGTCKKAEN